MTNRSTSKTVQMYRKCGFHQSYNGDDTEYCSVSLFCEVCGRQSSRIYPSAPAGCFGLLKPNVFNMNYFNLKFWLKGLSIHMLTGAKFVDFSTSSSDEISYHIIYCSL